MRKITLICVGTLKETYLKDALNEYKKRISRFFDLNIVELSEVKLQKSNPSEIQRVVNDEGEQILSKISTNQVFPLCIEGNELSSEQFARLIAESTDVGEITFIIGGSYGLSNSIKKQGKQISFGRLTYPHQLMRIMFLEQLYRAGTILNNVDYHK